MVSVSGHNRQPHVTNRKAGNSLETALVGTRLRRGETLSGHQDTRRSRNYYCYAKYLMRTVPAHHFTTILKSHSFSKDLFIFLIVRGRTPRKAATMHTPPPPVPTGCPHEFPPQFPFPPLPPFHPPLTLPSPWPVHSPLIWSVLGPQRERSVSAQLVRGRLTGRSTLRLLCRSRSSLCSAWLVDSGG